MFEKIKKWYMQGLWSEEKVNNAVAKGIITPQQAQEILKGEQYAEI